MKWKDNIARSDVNERERQNIIARNDVNERERQDIIAGNNVKEKERHQARKTGDVSERLSTIGIDEKRKMICRNVMIYIRY